MRSLDTGKMCLGILCLCASVVVGAFSYAAEVAPERATIAVPEIPVAALCSSYPPRGAVWVRAKITQQTDDDTFVIQDRTGQIILFLPTENLVALQLQPGMEILIYGTVDVSQVTPEKNEFYAQRILLPPKTAAIE